MRTIAVRRASSADLNELLALYDELAGPKLSAVPADHEVGTAVLEQILANPARELVVAVIDSELAGTADMVVVPNLTHRGEPWAAIENVIVTRRRQRAGVGRALFEHLVTVAQARGCHKVALLSGKHRVEAHHFYRSMGFEAVAEGFKLYLDE